MKVTWEKRCFNGVLAALIGAASWWWGDVDAPGSNSAWAASQANRPNIILVVVDTLRVEPIWMSGESDIYPRETSPNLFRFSQTAHTFHNAISAAPWTLPSFTSIMTGKFAFNHNMNDEINPDNPQTPDVPLLTDTLKDAGYTTVSIQTNSYLNYLDYGFDETYHFMDGSNPRADESAVNKALEWLNDYDAAKDGPFFLFIGLFSPHWPYFTQTGYFSEFVMDEYYQKQEQETITLSAGDDGRITYEDLPDSVKQVLGAPANGEGYYQDARIYQAAYDGEVRATDDRVGSLFNKLRDKGLYGDAAIIFTADHGEHMTEHDPPFSHGGIAYNSLLNVPMIIKMPNQSSGGSHDRLARTIDILPTVMGYADIETGEIDGKSLMPLFNYELLDPDERRVLAYRTDPISGAKELSVYRGGYHLIIRSDEELLFNLNSDPDEQTDLSEYIPWQVNMLKGVAGQHFDLDRMD